MLNWCHNVFGVCLAAGLLLGIPAVIPFNLQALEVRRLGSHSTIVLNMCSLVSNYLQLYELMKLLPMFHH